MRTPIALPLLAAAALLLTATACGEDDGSAPVPDEGSSSSASVPSDASPTPPGLSRTSGVSAQPSAGTSDRPSEDAPTREDCETLLSSASGLFVVDDVAVQPALAVLDGDVFVAWTGPGPGESGLAPWFARLDCGDGRWSTAPPRRLNPATEVSEGQPRLAASGDRLLAVWQRADGMENRVRLLLLDRAGEPLWPSPRSLEVSLRGEDVSDRTWQPDVVARPEGGWAIAATAVDTQWGGFRTVVVVLDEDAEPTGPAIPVMPAPPASGASNASGDPSDGASGGASDGAAGDRSGDAMDEEEAAERERWHEAPTLLSGPEGGLWVAWDRRSSEKDDTVFTVLRPDPDTGWTVGALQVALPEEARAVAGPAFARVQHGTEDRVWMTFAVFPGETAALALDVTDPAAVGEPWVLAEREAAFRTRLVQVASGDVLAAWQARDGPTGARGVIRTRWFRATADGLTPLGPPDPAGMRERTTHLVYPLALVASGNSAVLSWTAGAAELGWRTSVRVLSPR